MTYSHRQRLLAAALLILVTAACGGGAKEGSKRQGASRSEAGGNEESVSDAPGSTVPKPAPTTTTTMPGPLFIPQDPNQRQTAAPDIPGKASLERACVRRGTSDTQALIVQMPTSDQIIGYSTAYSDNSTSYTNRSLKTGDGYGKPDSSGRFYAAWPIPVTAPLGEATVHIISFHPVEPRELRFMILESSGKCP